MKKSDIRKIVLAYSGGLDTSVILSWLREHYEAEVVAFTADVGQCDSREELEKKALSSGASKFCFADLREEFVSEFVVPAIQAHALYEGRYFLGTALARPCIARKQVEIAEKEKADAVAHGATGKGNDQVRFELTYMALNPHLDIISPWRSWEMKSRTDMMNYARSKGINIEATLEKPYSKDKNVMHLSFEGGILEDPWLEPPPETYELANTPEKAPDEPEYVEIDFVDGKPAALNGARMPLFELFVKLNEIGGRHGIGRVDMVENRLVGIKSRGVYETPGGSILHAAHRDIEAMSLDRETAHFKEIVSIKFAQLIYNGLWFTTLREAISKFLEITQKGVTGKVRLKCYKGTCLAVGRTAEHSLYSRELATFEKEEIYNQFDAEGFIKLFGLQIRAKKLLSGIE